MREMNGWRRLMKNRGKNRGKNFQKGKGKSIGLGIEKGSKECRLREKTKEKKQ